MLLVHCSLAADFRSNFASWFEYYMVASCQADIFRILGMLKPWKATLELSMSRAIWLRNHLNWRPPSLPESVWQPSRKPTHVWCLNWKGLLQQFPIVKTSNLVKFLTSKIFKHHQPSHLHRLQFFFQVCAHLGGSMERGHYVAFINVGASLKAWLGCNSMRTTYNMYLYTDINKKNTDRSIKYTHIQYK